MPSIGHNQVTKIIFFALISTQLSSKSSHQPSCKGHLLSEFVSTSQFQTAILFLAT